MSENDIKKIQDLFVLIERMGVNREQNGVQYITYMLYRMNRDRYTDLERLYKITANHFRRVTSEEIRKTVAAVQTCVFGENVDIIPDTNGFIEHLYRVAFD
ncbi:MAG: hypothetical protein HFJ23_02885 [Clostridia bacterium]|nr:hypothetical protein [Clostridia bacterium]